MSREEPVPTGLCPVCGKDVPESGGVYGPVDAFDTSRCARKWFGTQLEIDKSVRTSKLALGKTGGFRGQEKAA